MIGVCDTRLNLLMCGLVMPIEILATQTVFDCECMQGHVHKYRLLSRTECYNRPYRDLYL